MGEREIKLKRSLEDGIFAHTKTGSERFEVAGKREWTLENSRGR